MPERRAIESRAAIRFTVRPLSYVNEFYTVDSIISRTPRRCQITGKNGGTTGRSGLGRGSVGYSGFVRDAAARRGASGQGTWLLRFARSTISRIDVSLGLEGAKIAARCSSV